MAFWLFYAEGAPAVYSFGRSREHRKSAGAIPAASFRVGIDPRSTIQDIARSGFHHWYYRTATQQLVAGRHFVAREILIDESGGGRGGGHG
ncbi:hypothetical protein RKD26_006068 [Streptomyces calvus]|uniref:hypothetical protein n=1 Tax=Streptomyces calvus TaxID=67282 RepID=UPI003516BEBE